VDYTKGYSFTLATVIKNLVLGGFRVATTEFADLLMRTTRTPVNGSAASIRFLAAGRARPRLVETLTHGRLADRRVDYRTYDVERNTTFWTTEILRHRIAEKAAPEITLYSNSLLALDPDTGK